MSNIIENTAWDNVGAGQVATLELPIGPTINGVLIQLSNGAGGSFTKSHITQLNVFVNDKLIDENHANGKPAGELLQSMNDYKNGASAANMLYLDFTESQSKDISSEFAGALGTVSGIYSVRLEMHIAATAVLPKLKSWAEVSGPSELGAFHCKRKFEKYIGEAGDHSILTLQKGELGMAFKRLWFYDPSSILDKIVIKKDGTEVFNATRAVNEFMQVQYDHTPQANLFCVDFIKLNTLLAEFFDTTTAKSVQIILTANAAGNLTYFTEALSDSLGKVGN